MAISHSGKSNALCKEAQFVLDDLLLVPDSKNPQCREGYLRYDLVGQKLNVLRNVRFLEEVFSLNTLLSGDESANVLVQSDSGL